MVVVFVLFMWKIKFPVEIRSSLDGVTIAISWVVTPLTKLHVVTSQKNVILNIQAVHLMSVTNCEYRFVGTQTKGEQTESWRSHLLLQSGYNGISYHNA